MSFDFGTLFHVEWSLAFLLAMLNIVFINIILSGDNAVLIAMAVRGLNKEQRKKGTLYGTAAAVLLRVILTFCVALLLDIPLLKLCGGLLILWIAMQLFFQSDGEGVKEQSTTLGQAIKIIIVADLTMSLDNVLGVAGAAGGNMFLLLFGLGVSIPIIVFTSNLVTKLMDRYPVIIVIGAAILGRVGGEMIITDSVVEKWLHPGRYTEYAFELFCMIAIVAAGKLWQGWKVRQAQRLEEAAAPDRREDAGIPHGTALPYVPEGTGHPVPLGRES